MNKRGKKQPRRKGAPGARTYPASKTRFGHFTPDAMEYVVTDPALVRPWYNCMANKGYSVMLSHTGGGYGIDNLITPMNNNTRTKWPKGFLPLR